MTFHGTERTADDVTADSHSQELSIEFELARALPHSATIASINKTPRVNLNRDASLPIEQKDFRCCDSRKRSPPDWPFG